MVSIRNVPGEIGFDGTTVTSGGDPFGTASGGAGNTFTVTFFGPVNDVRVDNLLQNLTFASPSTAPPSTRTLTITVRDAAGNPTVSTQGLVEVKGAQNPFNGIDIGNRSHPVLEDLDNSGDLDLVVGVGDGSVGLFPQRCGRVHAGDRRGKSLQRRHLEHEAETISRRLPSPISTATATAT